MQKGRLPAPFCYSMNNCFRLVVEVLSDLRIVHVLSGVPLAASVNIRDLNTVCSVVAKLNKCSAHGNRSLSDSTEQSSISYSSLDDSTGVEASAKDVILTSAKNLQVLICRDDGFSRMLVGAVDCNGVILAHQGVAVNQRELGGNLCRNESLDDDFAVIVGSDICTVHISGIAFELHGEAVSSAQLSKLIGVVLTERPDVQNMTVRDMVGMGRSPYTGFWGRLTAEDNQYVTEAMLLAGISTLEKRMFNTLSDGERQKVMIAKVLAQQTPVILLDEPTAFLDFPSKVEMMRLLRRLAHEMRKVIFLSTHDVEMALQLSDRLWIMYPGQVVIGSPAELSRNGELTRFIQADGICFDPELMSYRITQ